MLIAKFGGSDIYKRIEMYENQIGKVLPEQLHAFLEKYNGGETPNTKFESNGISSDVKAFLGMGEVKYSYDGINPIEDNGESYLPFAIDSFGNEFMVAMKSGEIAFRDHEDNSMKRVANDFRGFVDCCKSEKVNPSSVKSVEERERELIQRGRGSVVTEALRDMWRVEIDKYSSIKQEEVIL